MSHSKVLSTFLSLLPKLARGIKGLPKESQYKRIKEFASKFGLTLSDNSSSLGDVNYLVFSELTMKGNLPVSEVKFRATNWENEHNSYKDLSLNELSKSDDSLVMTVATSYDLSVFTLDGVGSAFFYEDMYFNAHKLQGIWGTGLKKRFTSLPNQGAFFYNPVNNRLVYNSYYNGELYKESVSLYNALESFKHSTDTSLIAYDGIKNGGTELTYVILMFKSY